MDIHYGKFRNTFNGDLSLPIKQLKTANYARYQKNTTQVITSGGFQPNTFVDWNLGLIFGRGNLDGTFDTSTGVFTCTGQGLYHFDMYYQYENVNEHDILEIFLGPYAQNDSQRSTAVWGYNYNASATFYLCCGETVSFLMSQNSGSNKNMIGAVLQIIKQAE